MKRIAYVCLLSIFLLSSCTTQSQPKLMGFYVSELLPDMDDGEFGQLQLSFTEDNVVFFHLSSYYQETFSYRQDSAHENIYYLNIDDQEIMINLLDDNSFYIPYRNNEFKDSADLMKYNGSAIQTAPLYTPPNE